jgi:hypothetical protein
VAGLILSPEQSLSVGLVDELAPCGGDPRTRIGLVRSLVGEPADNGFMSVVNGFVIKNGGWTYHNEGEFGWFSEEAFILDDSLFLKAGVIYEDYVNRTAN